MKIELEINSRVDASDILFLRKLKQLDLLSGFKKKQQEMIIPFVLNLELRLLDVMTIRDLCKIGGCQDDASLFFILAHMFSAINEGSICLNLSLMDSLPGPLKNKGDELKQSFLSRLDQGRYEKLVGKSSDSAYKPVVLDRQNREMLLYFQKYWVHENRFKTHVESFLTHDEPIIKQEPHLNDVIEKLYSDPLSIRVGKDAQPIQKDPHQIRAIKSALSKQFTIISGGPGTGKTSLLVNILRGLACFSIKPSEILLAAPTGRAAQRMTESIGNSIVSIRNPSKEDLELLKIEGSTIHRILKYSNKTNSFYHDRDHPLECKALIVDEVSMIDVILLDLLTQAIKQKSTRLIFIGDKDQLPSIEAGAVFSEMTHVGRKKSRFASKTVILKTVFRSGRGLKALSDQVNQGKMDHLTPVSFEQAMIMAEDNWAFVEAGTIKDWKSTLFNWCEKHYISASNVDGESYVSLIQALEKETLGNETKPHVNRLLDKIFETIGQPKVLALVKKGIFGTGFINRIISGIVREKLDPSFDQDRTVFTGAIVMITRNDYKRGLFNGDTGVICQDRTKTYHTVFKSAGGYLIFPSKALDHLEPAFAMTIHKSQGSEYNDVLLVLPDNRENRLLSREIVYTGITRARKRVVLYGTDSVLSHSLKRKIIRHSGLRW